MRRTPLMLLALLLALAMTACDGTAEEDRVDDIAEDAEEGETLTVSEAVSLVEAVGEEPDGQRVIVAGWYVEDEGDARLCESIMESFPPQCGGRGLQLEGLDPAQLDGVQSDQGVTWAEDEVEVSGTLRDGALHVDG
jgi:hypothetical protein